MRLQLSVAVMGIALWSAANSTWARDDAPTTKVAAKLGLYVQQDVIDANGVLNTHKLYFWASPTVEMSGWIRATVYARSDKKPRVYVGSFSCNLGSVAANSMPVVPAYACDIFPAGASATSNATLEADMYLVLTSPTNTELVPGVPASDYPPSPH